MTTSSKLKGRAAANGWRYMSVRADENRINKDFFARGSILVVVTYDVRGRISTARRSALGRNTDSADKLGPGTPDKVNRVYSWFRIQDK